MITTWRTPDGLALAASITCLAAVVGWSVWVESDIKPPVIIAPVAGQVEEGGDIAAGIAKPAEQVNWADPALGAADDAWVFDVFTPPVIYYDRETGRFSVSAPELTAPLESDVLNQPFGVSLVRVVLQPYRLQLVGYSGTETEPLGIFANQETGAGLVAKAGDLFGELGLELRTLAVRREDSIVPFSMPLREIVAVAEVWDTREHKKVRLSSARVAWQDQVLAEVRIDSTGEVRTIQAGNRIETDGGIFEFTGVFAGPDSVSAVKHLPSGVQESVKLTPDLAEEPQFGRDTNF